MDKFHLVFFLLLFSSVEYSVHGFELLKEIRDSFVRTQQEIWRTNPSVNLSTPEQCNRQCTDDEPPRICYYNFVLEYYTTMGAACDFCKPNATNQLFGLPFCECVLGDGMDKTVFTINRMIPGPSIQVCLGDTVVIDVQNKIDGIEVTLHWHGIYQNGYQYYDGVPFLTQCPILAHNTFRYQYTLKNAGTHFYHSHESVHMLDGQYGSLIVRKPPSLEMQKKWYDEDLPEHVMHISDWMHHLSIERYPGHYHYRLGQSAENILINGVGRWDNTDGWRVIEVPYAEFVVEKGKRYRFRMINGFSTVCPAQITIQNHNMTIIALDGDDVEPTVVDGIVSATGERYDFVINANQPTGIYWIQVRGIGECEETEIQQFALLRYQGASNESLSATPGYQNGIPFTVLLNPPNSTDCENPIPEPGRYCINQLKSVEEPDPDIMKVTPDYRLVTSFSFFTYSDDYRTLFGNPGVYKTFFVAPDKTHLVSLIGNVSYSEPQSPLLSQREGYQEICSDEHTPQDCTEPCSCTHVYHWPLGKVIEVVLYDTAPLNMLEHPFHLHGYAFTVFTIGQIDKDNVTREEIDAAIAEHDQRLRNNGYHKPPKKDTIIVPVGGYVIYRFITDNPGWWLHHCHFSWHTATGMDVVFHVGEKRDLPPVPRGFPKCYSWTPPVQVPRN